MNSKGNDVVDAVMFQAEIRRIEKLLYRIAWSYLGNNADVEDAVQDALIKAWEKRLSLRDMKQFKPWITRILMNQCKDQLRKRKKWSFYPLEDAAAQEVEPPEPDAPVLEAIPFVLLPADPVMLSMMTTTSARQRKASSRAPNV